MLVHSVTNAAAPPLEMPARFRTDVAYFMTPAGERGVGKLPTGEYWIDLDDARRWLADGVVPVISPLDSQHETEFELSDDHERFLQWVVKNAASHVRIGSD